jgi:hypothetical protein
LNLLDAVCEPPLQLPPTRSNGQKMNSESYFAKDYRIDDDLLLMVTEPVDNPLGWFGPRGFAEDIGIDEVIQSVSVDSDSIGVK